MTSPITSPRLSQLQTQLKDNLPKGLIDFWNEIAISGSPLIEKSPITQDKYSVTFVWRGTENTTAVFLCGPLGYQSVGHFAKSQMTQMPETDLWFKTIDAQSDLRIAYRISPVKNEIPRDDMDWKDRIRRDAVVDPFNPNQFKGKWVESVVELPDAPARKRVEPLPNMIKGTVKSQTFESALLNNKRDLWIYTPPQYTPKGHPYGLLILFDGYAYIHWMPAPTILDNLYAREQIPPLVAVFVGSPDRNVELVCYPPFVAFLAQELVPWIRHNYHVTDDPQQTIVGGSSYGGLAATFAALNYPNIFGRVLAQSGSFHRQVGDDPEQEWLKRQLPKFPESKLHCYFDVGFYETGMQSYIKNMRDALRARGHSVEYREFNGGHHSLNWQYTLGQGIGVLTL